MLTAVAIIASLVLVGWLIFRAVKQKLVRASTVTRGVAYVAAVFTYAYFLTMTIPDLVKIAVSIILGMILIVIAAYLQRRQQEKV